MNYRIIVMLLRKDKKVKFSIIKLSRIYNTKPRDTEDESEQS